MKRIIMLLLTTLSLFFLFLYLSFDNASFAQQGCCKVRKSRSGRWYIKDYSFEQCRQLNDERDGDDVFYDRGRVWWDERC